MKLKYLAAAGAASLLMAGAAYAQSTGSGSASTGATLNPTPPAGAYPSTGSATATPSTTAPASTSAGVATSSTTTSADVAGQNASVTTTMTTNGPVPDTPENRAKFGGPMSRAGKHTAAKGN